MAAWIEFVLTAPLAFAIGLIVGFILSNKYRITRRNGDKNAEH